MYLPKNPELLQKLEAIPSQEQFVAAVLEQGSNSGFAFSREDVVEVIRISAQRLNSAELSDAELGQVTGGAIASLSGSYATLRTAGGLAITLRRAPGKW